MERFRATSTAAAAINVGSQKPTSTITFHSSPSPFLPLPLKPLHSPRRLLLDAELSIFDAQRYFNDSTPHHSLHPVQNPALPTHSNPDSSSVSSFTRNYRNNSFNGTPTASSEASWNSQSGLLPNAAPSSAAVRTFPLNEPRKPAPFSPRRTFRRPCPCSGKKSIDVEEKYTSVKYPSVKNAPPPPPTQPLPPLAEAETEIKMQILAGNWAKERELFQPMESRFPVSAGFSFPILKPAVSRSNKVEDPARESLEVFKPNRRGYAFPGSPRGTEDDVGSDASSDLFELESFSAYKRRDSLEEAASAAARLAQIRRNIESSAAAAEPGEHYAPSEVSVAWSVTTAEGFDRASAANFSSSASDYGVRIAEPDRTGGKRKGNALLSCVCEKAVNVGPVPVRLEPEQPRRAGPVEVDRVHGMSTLVRANVGLVGSNSARMSRSMAPR